jgi:hypothetical protein
MYGIYKMNIILDYLDVFGVGICIREKCSCKMDDIDTTIIAILLLGNLKMKVWRGKQCVDQDLTLAEMV